MAGRGDGGAAPGVLVSSRVSQARGNGVGKDAAPYGANESREDFQQRQIPFQLSLSPGRRASSQYGPGCSGFGIQPGETLGQAAELGWTLVGKVLPATLGMAPRPVGRMRGFLVAVQGLGQGSYFPLLDKLGRCWEGAKAAGAALPSVPVPGRNIPGLGPGQAGRSPWPTSWKPALIWLGFNPWREGKNPRQLLWFEGGMWVHGHTLAEPPPLPP